MPQYLLQKNHLHRSLLGVIRFTKGEPTWAPSYMERELAAIGALRVDGEPVDSLPEEAAPPPVLSDSEREDAVFSAFDLIVEANEAGNFTVSGRPKVRAVEALAGFDLTPVEMNGLWDRYRQDRGL